jgi:2-dehydro-3-deoxyphosphogluconate aldolase / (4S)-4-hydroxy-2-oxoglutarate aldolase
MSEILRRIGEIGIVPVIKIESADKAVPLGRALAGGGIPVAEVTFRTKAAPDAIRAMAAELPDLLVGAGTVTSVAMAESAAAAGAKFIVCPAWDDAVVDWCLGRGMPVLPGVSGPDGVLKGVSKGLEVLKFFPAEALGGLGMLDSLSGPFPGVKFVPTGGIDAANIGAYARKHYVLAVGGSWMVKSDMIEAGDWAAVERLCREAVLALHGFQLAHVGINDATADEASKDAAALASLFGFALKEGNSSIFAADCIELLKGPYLGEKGHIAIRCNDVERAVARFRGMGVGIVAGSEKPDKGRLKTVYLDKPIGGFAFHLLRA